MNTSKQGIGSRLALVFAAVLLFAALAIGVGVSGFNRVQQLNASLLEGSVVKANLINTIDLTTRANARLSMELLIAANATRLADIKSEIDKNKKTIDVAFQAVEQQEKNTEAADVLQQLKSQRAAYVASFSKVRKLVDEGMVQEASVVMGTDTLAALDALQTPINTYVKLQQTAVQYDQAALESLLENAKLEMIAAGLLAVVVGIACAIWITRTITGPLLQATRLSHAVASGDLSTSETIQRDDETGKMLGSLLEMQESLAQVVTQVRTGSDVVAGASAEIALANADLASRTETHASTLEQTAASVEELSAAVKLNAENSSTANQLAISSSQIAAKGGQVVARVVETMQGINESSRKINDIISVIDGIAFQTNILALNAAVEAARAGEQGRGFAVVAAEVRSLAGRSAAAAKEIKSLIDASVHSVEEGTNLVNSAGSTMRQVESSIAEVTQLMGAISAASHQQAIGVAQVGEALTHLDQATQQNAALVEEMASAAANLDTQAKSLVSAVDFFKIGQTPVTQRMNSATELQLPARRELLALT